MGDELPTPPVADASATGTPGGGSAVPTPGTATPFELDAEQREASLKVSLADLTARGTAHYAHKNYDDAAEVFAQAAEMQAEMHGEMSPDNAEILFLYGRALFKVGQSKSDVLGGKAPATGTGAAPAEKKGAAPKKKAKKDPAAAAAAPALAAVAEAAEGTAGGEGALAAAAAGKAGEKSAEVEKGDESGEKKPLFQFTGDENFDESDEEEVANEEAEGEGEEEEDDLAVAFEILDLARLLFIKRLEIVEGEKNEDEGKGKGKEVSQEDSPALRHITERLGDTHDLLAEISLENERYPNAITDSRASLKYKQQLFPEESEIVAEAHFKLSLALEFASVTTTSEEETDKAGPKPVDQSLRDEAAAELEAAIASTKLKLQGKEVELATLHSPEDNESTRKQIAEVKDIISDMEQRLVDLQKPPIDMNAALYGAGGNALGGLLGAAAGESPALAESRIEQAKKTATDLSGLVRKKAKEEPKGSAAGATSDSHTNGHEANGGTKRKAGDDESANEAAGIESKKAKVEDTSEA